MSSETRSTKSKSSTKSTVKTPAKSATKTAGKAKSGGAGTTKSRLVGPKPPKPPKARATAAKTTAAAKPAVPASGVKRPSTSKIPAPGPMRKPAVPKPAAVTPLPEELKKQELVDMVVAKSDVKKKYAKPVVEAMLEVLGDTLAKGREMNLQPFGKVKYNRTKETSSARVVVAKVRQSKRAKAQDTAPKDPLADAAE